MLGPWLISSFGPSHFPSELLFFTHSHFPLHHLPSLLLLLRLLGHKETSMPSLPLPSGGTSILTSPSLLYISFSPPSQSLFSSFFLADILSTAVKVDSSLNQGVKKKQWEYQLSSLPTCTAILLVLQRKAGWGAVGGAVWTSEFVCDSERNEERAGWEIKTRNEERKISWGDIILLFPFSPFLCLCVPLAGMWEWLRASAGCTCDCLQECVFEEKKRNLWVCTSAQVHVWVYVWHPASPVFTLLWLNLSYLPSLTASIPLSNSISPSFSLHPLMMRS